MHAPSELFRGKFANNLKTIRIRRLGSSLERIREDGACDQGRRDHEQGAAQEHHVL
jgi:hypothetical protein